MTKLIYREAAAADVQDAYEWYQAQRIGLGEEFLAELAVAERSILASPEAFQGRSQTDASLPASSRFPYQVLYRILDDQIVVLACFHVRRSPRRIRERDDG